MKKSVEEKREERIKEIAELTKKRDEINARLNYLTGLADSTSTSATENPVPVSFSYSREVENLFNETHQLRILQATALLQKKYPQYQIERQKVHSALVYLNKQGKIKKEPTERGLFSLKT